MIEILTLTYRDGAYYVNHAGDQDGEYVRLADYQVLVDERDILRQQVETLKGKMADIERNTASGCPTLDQANWKLAMVCGVARQALAAAAPTEGE